MVARRPQAGAGVGGSAGARRLAGAAVPGGRARRHRTRDLIARSSGRPVVAEAVQAEELHQVIGSTLSCPICSPERSLDDAEYLYYPPDEEIPVSLCKHLYGYPRDLTDHYEMIEVIGKGSFGTVHSARRKDTGEVFAVKTIPKSRPTWTGGMDGGMREATTSTYLLKLQDEVNFLARLSDVDAAVRLAKAYEDDTNVHLVMDLCTGGSLFEKMEEGVPFPQAKAVMQSVIGLLATCHSRGIIYRDVKPQNFMFVEESEDSSVKCSDFGLASPFIPGEDFDLAKRAGTPVYMAPEVVLRKYGAKADCWSAGMLMYQLITGRLPFWGGEVPLAFNLDQIFFDTMIKQVDFAPVVEAAGEDAADLCQRLLARDPEFRMSSAQAQQHPWLAS